MKLAQNVSIASFQVGELADQSKLMVTTPHYPHTVAPPTPQFYHHVTTAQHASMAMRPSAPGAVMAWPTAPPVGPKYRY
ncbi:hypothetical protein DICVIV_04409 [Dictyocaulus viviparus]|uniref:Uncharacterized protein n=1 Tax=Dictyocaulus viviparus TaxID=29172 RepID=A0A0D8Y010_DICVI|nr:hypothetical protein DICVIV_04409 [Dictyocaulus viviparus]